MAERQQLSTGTKDSTGKSVKTGEAVSLELTEDDLKKVPAALHPRV